MKLLCSLLFMMSLSGFSQHTLTVKVTGVASADGLIGLGVYNTSETWLKDGKTFTGVFAKAEKGSTMVTIEDIAAGTYAISVYHDENGDKELNTNILGIPKEPLGFSIGKLKTFGPPSFEECAFEITSDFEIEVPVK